jgi:hypothetical protein
VLNGRLKGRFRCLLKDRTLHYNPIKAAKVIYNCVVLHNTCQHCRVPWPDPDINEQENGGNYNFENNYDAQNHFSFKDKGNKMRLQIHILIENKKKQINIINRYTMKNELIYNLLAAYLIASLFGDD